VKAWGWVLALLVVGCRALELGPADGTLPIPSSGEGMASAFDEARAEWVVLSAQAVGISIVERRSVTWAWAGESWRVIGADGLPARYGSAMAWDPVREALVVFGGRLAVGSTPLDDTWLWDGETWTQLTGPGPPAHWGHRLVWVPPRNALMLVGGLERGCEVPPCGGTWWLGAEGWVEEP
jgi:hypothetical protein